MGQSIDIHIYELDGLKEALKKRGAEGERLDNILAKCGLVSGGKYILLNNEVWDGYSPYYNLSTLIDCAFGVKDSYKALLAYDKPYHQCGINSVDIDEAAEELGITLIEEDEE